MNRMNLSSALAALVLGSWSAGMASAQSSNAPLDAQYAQQAQLYAQQTQQTQQTQQKAQQQAQKESQQGAQSAQKDIQGAQRDMQKELESAREELQRAAREVARLSGEIAEPFVTDVQRRFRYVGQRAMLGLGIEDTERGVRVASVSPNGPGGQAGLVVGDVIVKVDGANLADTRPTGGGKQSPSELLMAQMANVKAGEDVKLRVLNEAGAERDVVVKARELSPRVFVNPSSFNYSFAGPGGAWFFGPNPWSQIQLITMTPGLGSYFGTSKGLLVVHAPDNAALQLKDGDVILDISGREPTSPEHAMRILGSFEQGEALKIAIMRNKSRQTLDVKLPAQDSRD